MLSKLFRFSILFLVCGLLSGCTKASSLNGESCMTPLLTEIPSPIPQIFKEWLPIVPARKPIPEWWQPQLSSKELIGARQDDEKEYKEAGDIVQLNNDLWISFQTTVVRYDTASGNLKYYQGPELGTDTFLFEDLFISSDGTLWAGGTFISTEQNYIALSVFNPQTDTFEVVYDKDGYLIRTAKSATYTLSYAGFLAELPNQDLVINIGSRVLTYDPSSNTAQKIPVQYEVATIAVSEDGKILFSVRDLDDWHIRTVNPETHQVTDYGSAVAFTDDLMSYENRLKTLFVDSKGQVWVSYLNRLDPDPDKGFIWKNLDRSPLLIDFYDPDYKYVWSSVSNMYEFSDGNIWFDTGMGIIKQDTSTDDWCWSSPLAEGGIAEDHNGNLWIVADGQIYKTSILPQSAP